METQCEKVQIKLNTKQRYTFKALAQLFRRDFDYAFNVACARFFGKDEKIPDRIPYYNESKAALTSRIPNDGSKRIKFNQLIGAEESLEIEFCEAIRKEICFDEPTITEIIEHLLDWLDLELELSRTGLNFKR